MLELKNVSRTWGNFSLQNIDLVVKKNDYFVILGPCGSGKTKLLELITGVYQCDRGSLILDGRDITRMLPEKRNISLAYQDHCLFPHLSVKQNIVYGLKYRDLTKKEQEQRLARIVDLLKLEKVIEQDSPEKLSGGEKQKVSLARALIVQPRILLLDEPLTSLDPGFRESMLSILADINRKLKLTVIHVTHDQSEAAALAKNIAILNEGKIVQQGERDQVMTRPATKFVADFLGFGNVFPLEGTEEKKECLLIRTGKLLLKIDQTDLTANKKYFYIKPDDIVVSPHPGVKKDNVIKGKLVEISDRQFWIRIRIRSGETEFVVLEKKNEFISLNITLDSTVYLGFDKSSIHFI